jgi:hypothetical protein
MPAVYSGGPRFKCGLMKESNQEHKISLIDSGISSMPDIKVVAPQLGPQSVLAKKGCSM